MARHETHVRRVTAYRYAGREYKRYTAATLSHYALALERELGKEVMNVFAPPPPWPARPTLPNRGQKKLPQGQHPQRSPK
jgi:hypothetical protein